MLTHRSILLATILASFFAARAHAAPVPVTTCGQTVSEGVLVADLDCSAEPGFAVTVSHQGSLDLAGYQLTGTADHSLDWQTPVYGGAVHCLGECTVKGGGAVVAPAGGPVPATYSIGIYSDPTLKESRVRLENVTVSGWASYGAKARHMDVSGGEVSGNLYGIVATRRLVMDGCILTGNGEGAHVFFAEISNSTLDANDTGLYVLRKARLLSSSVSANQNWGVRGVKMIAIGSALENNCLTPDPACADLVVRKRPRLIDSTCATTFDDLRNTDWNVCSED